MVLICISIEASFMAQNINYHKKVVLLLVVAGFLFLFLINVYKIKLVNSVIQVFYILANSLSIG